MKKKPKITIIVPLGLNRELEVLESLKAQEEIVKIIIQKGTHPSKNRNKGIKKSKTSIIAFVDAHSILPRKWSKNVIDFFLKYPEVDIVGGPQLTPEDEPFFGKASGHALSSIFGSAETSTRYKIKKPIFDANEKFLTSANLACRRKVLKKIKFDENIYPGEDPKFIADAKNAGFCIAYSPDIIAHHRRRRNLKELAKQIFYYGKTRPKKESIIKTLAKPSFLVPSLFIIYLLLLPTLFLLHYLFIIPLGIYIFLNLTFSLYESLKNNSLKAFFVLPFIFFTIHIAYGLGFITGMFQKIFWKGKEELK